MKKYFLFLVLLFSFVFIPNSVNAANASIRVSSSSSTAIVGSTINVNVTVSSSAALGSWEFLLTYNSSYLQLVSSNTESGGVKAAGYVSNANTKSKTYTFRFKALKSGTVQIGVGSYLVYGFDESVMSVSPSSSSVRIMTQSELQATYSKDNNLSSLGVEGYSLSPEFSSSVLEYQVTVPSTVDKINVVGSVNESHATVSGLGEHEVIEGSNTFEIKVTAQNGDEKTYKLVVNVEDANPVALTVNENNYTVVKNIKNVTIPNLFVETTITINGVEVPAFKNDVTDYTLLAVKGADGEISFVIYNENGNYQLYLEETSQTLTLSILDLEFEMEGYIKTNVTIHDHSYEAYKVNEDSDYAIIYAMNMETGEKNYYLYHAKEHTYQIYFDEMVRKLQDEKEKYKFVILGSAGVIVLLILLCMIGFLRKPNKKLLQKIALMEEQKKKGSVVEKEEEKTISSEEKAGSLEEDKKASKKKAKKEKKSKRKKDKEIVTDVENSNTSTETNESNTKKEEIPEVLEVDEAIHKMNDAEEIIREFEKTMALSKEELKEAKKEKENSDSSKSTEEMEATMYDLFEDDRKKKKSGK